MNHPCHDLESTPLWRSVDRAVAELERNGDLSLTTARTHVVGHLCRAITESGLAVPPDARRSPA